MKIKELDKKYIANTYSRFPITIVKGKGSILVDDMGKRYIDFGSGIAVNTFGISDDSWALDVINQIKTLTHTSNLYYTEPNVKLAKMLCKKTGFKKVFFCNSGAEANECAIKVARKYGEENLGQDYFNIITLKGSFHGRTITTLSATGQENFHNIFKPFTNGFLYAMPNDIKDIENLLKKNKCCGVMIEIIQGEGGINVLDENYLKQLNKLCKKYNVILIVDEVQTGNGRTGKFYSYMHSGIEPDIITTAKGLGGGLPIGATLLNEKVQNILKEGMHGSTFGGNPICCTAGINVVSRIDEKFLEEVKDKSDLIINSLKNCKNVISINGLGLMLGVETVKNVDDVINDCIGNGLLVIKAKNKIRILPALNIDNDLLEKGINILKTVLEK